MPEVKVKTSGNRREIVSRPASTINERRNRIVTRDMRLLDALDQSTIYTLNTGLIALTGTGTSALFYFKNNSSPSEGSDQIYVDSIRVGMGPKSGSKSDDAVFTIIRNPTGGDIISDATALDSNSNHNFDSSDTMASEVNTFKGKDGGTMTGGTTHDTAYLADSSTTILPVTVLLEVGNSIGVSIDLNTSGAGGSNVYVSMVCHRRNEEL